MTPCPLCHWFDMKLVQISAQTTLWHYLCGWCDSLFPVLAVAAEPLPDLTSKEGES